MTSPRKWRAKLYRSKLGIKCALINDSQEKAALYELIGSEVTAWREMCVWSPLCGRCGYLPRVDTAGGASKLCCPDCYDTTDTYTEHTSLVMCHKAVGYEAAVDCVIELFEQRANAVRAVRRPSCEGCDVRLQMSLRAEAQSRAGGTREMYLAYEARRSSVSMRLRNFVLYQLVASKFWRSQLCIRLLPEHPNRDGGRSATVLSRGNLPDQA